jgi:hypothetical protein
VFRDYLFLNLKDMNNDAAAKTMSKAVLFGAQEQTPKYPSRLGLLASAGKRVITANATKPMPKKPETMRPAVLVIVPN